MALTVRPLHVSVPCPCAGILGQGSMLQGALPSQWDVDGIHLIVCPGC